MRSLLKVAWDKATVVPIRVQANPSHRILAVDDETDNRQLTAEVLARSGFAMDSAEDGIAGWEALPATHYHLLITDDSMPRLSGLELVKRLCSARMALPVAIAPGRSPTHLLARNPSLQLEAMLLEPFAVDELLDKAKKVLRATDSACAQIKFLPDWRRQTPADGLQL